MSWLEPIVAALTGLGPWAPVLFVFAYVVASITLAPAVVLTFAAGAVFGLWWGTVLVYVGAVFGSSAVFFLASPLAKSRLVARIDRDARVAAVRQALVGDRFWLMFLLRLSPLVPFVFLNYALALAGVRYTSYLMATVGMLPAIVLYVYYGKVVGDVAALATGLRPPRTAAYYTLLGVGLAATIMATTIVTRAARRAVEQGQG
jgi:uncharacterized membrane protein YdjX (TVP38/TMEM64 family)